MKADRLFDAGPRGRRRHEWGRWLPVLAAALCPRRSCKTPLFAMDGGIQLALFIHGGYGAAERTVLELCPSCGWARTKATETVNPLRVRSS